jgi:hypothetical protein
LKRAGFAASEVRRGLQRMFKDIDLEDPQIEQTLRQLTVSSKPSSKSANSIESQRSTCRP